MEGSSSKLPKEIMMAKLKYYGSLALFVVYLLFVGYMSYINYKHPNPRLLEFTKTPVSWIDLAIGFFTGAIVMILAMLYSISWPYTRKGDGGSDGGGTPKRRINLPMLGKVISIEEFKKMPPNGPLQLAATGTRRL